MLNVLDHLVGLIIWAGILLLTLTVSVPIIFFGIPAAIDKLSVPRTKAASEGGASKWEGALFTTFLMLSIFGATVLANFVLTIIFGEGGSLQQVDFGDVKVSIVYDRAFGLLSRLGVTETISKILGCAIAVVTLISSVTGSIPFFVWLKKHLKRLKK
jgi:hypothetical protein